MAREIILSDRFPEYIATVDDEDYDYLIQWRWTFKRSQWKVGGIVYACRNTWTGNIKFGTQRRVKLMLHNVVLERAGVLRPSPDHTVHHINSKTLDNRRANLVWANKSEQNKYAWVTRKQNRELDRVPDGQSHPVCDPWAEY